MAFVREMRLRMFAISVMALAAFASADAHRFGRKASFFIYQIYSSPLRRAWC